MEEKLGRGKHDFGQVRQTNQGVDPDIQRAIDRAFNKIRPRMSRVFEAVEKFIGERGINGDRAVTREDMKGLQDLAEYIPANLYAAGAAPTKAEFDALVDALDNINQNLDRIARALSGEND